MAKIKDGEYAVYQDREYAISSKETPPDFIRLISWEKSDLNRGFICYESEEFIKKFGFYCEKEVPKSEITEAYDIRTHAVYKGVGASIVGCLKPNWIGLMTACLYNEDKEEFLKMVNKAGFKYYGREQGGVDVYAIDVSLDDPDLQLIQKRKELDISKL